MARTRRPAVPWPTILRELTIVGIDDVTATTRRLTLAGDAFGGFVSTGFDDHVKVLVPVAGQDRPPLPVQGPDRLEWGAAGGRPVAKDYTPRRVTDSTVDLDFVLHGEGFASGWAQRASLGDPAWIVGPTRSLQAPPDVDHWLVAGDETALPAIARLLDEAPEDLSAHVVIEVPSPASIQPLRDLPGVDVRWVHDTAAWHEQIATAPLFHDAWPGDRTFCWVAGEAGACRQARSVVAARVPRDCLDVTGYWRR